MRLPVSDEAHATSIFLWIYRGVMLPAVGVLLTWVWGMQNEVTNLRVENQIAFSELSKYEQLTKQLTGFEAHIRGYTQAISDGVARPTTIKIDSSSLLETVMEMRELQDELIALEDEWEEEWEAEVEAEAAEEAEATLKEKVADYFSEFMKTEEEKKAEAERKKAEAEKRAAELAAKKKAEAAKLEKERIKRELERLKKQQQEWQAQQQVQQQQQQYANPMLNPDKVKPLDDEQLDRYIENKKLEYTKKK